MPRRSVFGSFGNVRVLLDHHVPHRLRPLPFQRPQEIRGGRGCQQLAGGDHIGHHRLDHRSALLLRRRHVVHHVVGVIAELYGWRWPTFWRRALNDEGSILKASKSSGTAVGRVHILRLSAEQNIPCLTGHHDHVNCRKQESKAGVRRCKLYEMAGAPFNELSFYLFHPSTKGVLHVTE